MNVRTNPRPAPRSGPSGSATTSRADDSSDTSERARAAVDAAAAGILLRAERLPNLAQVEVMSPAATPSARALMGMQRTVEEGRLDLRRQLHGFRSWLRGPGQQVPVYEVQRRYTVLRLRWMGVLTQYDIFADALSQRSEHPIGLWLAGLDHLAADALSSLGGIVDRPEMITYLDRGAGAAIRRARTRLPGGLRNPVAIIRVPRERMIGTGVGSSLVHEVGHQAAALLCLVESLRRDFGERVRRSSGIERRNWGIYRRWASEILADFWSVGMLGMASTLGLIEVVSLPRPFVFRVSLNDPHPAPWIRVRLSARIGEAVHPDRAWYALADSWTARYPLAGPTRPESQLVRGLDSMTAEVAAAVVDHEVEGLDGRRVVDLVPAGKRRPSAMSLLATESASTSQLARLRPTLALAVLGAEAPSTALDRTVDELLTAWAMAAIGGGSPS